MIRNIALFAATAVLLLGAPAFADDMDTLMKGCRSNDGGLPEPVCRCIAAKMTKQDLATYAQLVKARMGTSAQAEAFERKNAPFLNKYYGVVDRCIEEKKG